MTLKSIFQPFQQFAGYELVYAKNFLALWLAFYRGSKRAKSLCVGKNTLVKFSFAVGSD